MLKSWIPARIPLQSAARSSLDDSFPPGEAMRLRRIVKDTTMLKESLMKKSYLFDLWAFLFIICAGLGFIPEPEGALRVLLTLAAVAFFVPPAVLLYRAGKAGNKSTIQLVRNLSAASLALTLLFLVVNVLSALGSTVLGNVLYYILVIVSSPMVCSGYWGLSLFLWACLLMASLQQLKKK